MFSKNKEFFFINSLHKRIVVNKDVAETNSTRPVLPKDFVLEGIPLISVQFLLKIVQHVLT